MDLFYADITFDFDDAYFDEKVIFLEHLFHQNWINNNSEFNWKVPYNGNIEDTELLEIITKNINDAVKISNIDNVDYAIIMNKSIFFGSVIPN